MQQTRQFLQLIQGEKQNEEDTTDLNNMNFSPEQELTVRKLIEELKMHLKTFTDQNDKTNKENKDISK